MADSDLPVWSFRANWREPMQERLSFLTDVLRAEEGAEQRRSLRSTPRRAFECELLLSGPERTFLDLFVNRLGGGEMMIPLYWDVARITGAAVEDVTDRLLFDTTGHEFSEGLAIISGKTAFEYEVVEIAAVDPDGIDLAAPVTRPWPKGAKVIPLRRGLIDGSSPVLAHRTGAVAVTTAGFVLTCPNPWTPAEDDSPVYAGRPVFLNEPNWVEGIEHVMDRETFRLDNLTGLPYQTDALNRALIGQSHRWFLPGREKLAGFRDLIYRHRGRAGSFWLPTFKHDLRMAAAITSVSTTLVIENVGFGYTGGPTAGREYIAIKHDGGTILRKIVGYEPGLIAGTERLGLDAPLGLALSPGQVRRISFADVARFDQDDFEITHYGGVDALHECQSMFRTFVDTRDPAGVIDYPIPEAEVSNTPCGVVDEQPECYAVPVFEGWYLKIRVSWINPSVPEPYLGFVAGHGSAIDIPFPVVVPSEYIEWTSNNPDTMNEDDAYVQVQFSFGSVSGGMKGIVSYRRWTDLDYTVALPLPGSDMPDEGGGVFGLYNLFPLRQVFNF